MISWTCFSTPKERISRNLFPIVGAFSLSLEHDHEALDNYLRTNCWVHTQFYLFRDKIRMHQPLAKENFPFKTVFKLLFSTQLLISTLGSKWYPFSTSSLFTNTFLYFGFYFQGKVIKILTSQVGIRMNFKFMIINTKIIWWLGYWKNLDIILNWNSRNSKRMKLNGYNNAV